MDDVRFLLPPGAYRLAVKSTLTVTAAPGAIEVFPVEETRGDWQDGFAQGFEAGMQFHSLQRSTV